MATWSSAPREATTVLVMRTDETGVVVVAIGRSLAVGEGPEQVAHPRRPPRDQLASPAITRAALGASRRNRCNHVSSVG